MRSKLKTIQISIRYAAAIYFNIYVYLLLTATLLNLQY